MSSSQALVGILLLFSFHSTDITTRTNAEEPEESLQVYIVHVRPTPPQHTGTDKEWHESFLLNSSRLLHSFSHAISGFSAELTPSELDHIRSLEGFVHATPSETHTIQTTHSPSFLHLNTNPSGFWVKSGNYGKGTIIGVLDTGIVPTHPSFDGAHMPKPPSKWKGACNFSGGSFPCNNKIIGARNFVDGREIPPYDEHGHGTQVSSIAAGRFVPNASVLGSAMGTAAGIAPFAHIAVYKACNQDGKCLTHVVAAAMDVALSDGVDVISISIHGPATRFHNDLKAILGYAAVKRGVFVTMIAGNDGPIHGSVHNISPWVLTVGASTMDRRIKAVVKLGDGTKLAGESAYQPRNLPNDLPLVFPPDWMGDPNAPFCSSATTLRYVGVEGKVVVCKAGIDPTHLSKIVKEAGGASMIHWGPQHYGYDTHAFSYEIPVSYVTHVDGLTISKYNKWTTNPTASIRFEGTVFGGLSDPAVAAFSSRGPSKVHDGILKPDIVGPGINILVASIHPPFDLKYGTSLSCPHLAGVVALLKNSHPDWSPAMIKSAIMTTADVTNSEDYPIIDSYNRKKASFYAMGAGHVNPVRANNPGLVYDIKSDHYIRYLCGSNYTDHEVGIITGDHTISCKNYTKIAETDLNYPSMVVFLSKATSFPARIRRTLTNVGRENSTYTAHVLPPHGITIDVLPSTLQFPGTGDKRSFSVYFGIKAADIPRFSYEAYLVWISSEGTIKVRSPIIIRIV